MEIITISFARKAKPAEAFKIVITNLGVLLLYNWYDDDYLVLYPNEACLLADVIIAVSQTAPCDPQGIIELRKGKGWVEVQPDDFDLKPLTRGEPRDVDVRYYPDEVTSQARHISLYGPGDVERLANALQETASVLTAWLKHPRRPTDYFLTMLALMLPGESITNTKNVASIPVRRKRIAFTLRLLKSRLFWWLSP